jgi:hypothetical protein
VAELVAIPTTQTTGTADRVAERVDTHYSAAEQAVQEQLIKVTQVELLLE